MSLREEQTVGAICPILTIVVVYLLIGISFRCSSGRWQWVPYVPHSMLSSRETEPLLPHCNAKACSVSYLPRRIEVAVNSVNGDDGDECEAISPSATPQMGLLYPPRGSWHKSPYMKVAPASTITRKLSQKERKHRGTLSMHFRKTEAAPVANHQSSDSEEEYIEESSTIAQDDAAFKATFAGLEEFKLYVRGMNGRWYTKRPSQQP